jgi:hypothetical protein
LPDSFTEDWQLFAIDLQCSVHASHDIVTEELNRQEEASLAELTGSDPSRPWHLGLFYGTLRQATSNLAMVALVTRLDHWVARLWKRVNQAQDPNEVSLAGRLRDLDGYCGAGCPVPVGFFEELVAVRNSVVHRNSAVEWVHRGRPMRVAERYRSGSGMLVTVTGAHLKEASDKSIAAVRWYDERMLERIGIHSAQPQ